MMNAIRLATFAAIAAGVCLAPTAKADEWNKKTILTVKETIQLPNAVLQPGTYTLKLLDSQSDRHIVQVFDKDGMHLITTILAIPNYRLQPTGHSEFSFWEVPAGQPPAMRAWFYPGDNFGQEFAYPKNLSQQIATIAKAPVPTVAATSSEEYKTAPISVTDSAGASATLDASTYTPPAPQPAPVAAPAPAPAEPTELAASPAPTTPQQPEPAAELPHTASSIPLIGLIGLISLAAFIAVRPSRVR
jgi:hypothetical protein